MTETKFSNSTVVDTADALSARLYILREIAHLAAFAAEARRTLQGVENALGHMPEFDKVLSQQVVAHNNWATMDDSAGTVMQWVAREMASVDESMTAALYAIADGEGAPGMRKAPT